MQLTQRVLIFFLLSILAFPNYTIANNDISASAITINIAPEHADWIYQTGETAIFKVSLNNNMKEGTLPYSVRYEVGPEKMPPVKSEAFESSVQSFVIDGGTMKTPGFLRCKVVIKYNGKEYSEIATAAFEPEKIEPTIKRPADFEKFWSTVIKEVRDIPLDAKMTLLDEKCTKDYNVYQVDYLNNEFKSRSYGLLTVPTKEGKYAAVIRFPGAGVHPLGGNLKLAKDVITLDVYIHPFPITWDRAFYDNLKASPYIDYKFLGVQNRDTYYFKKVISGCLKAVDVIYSLPQFDGKNLASWGSSQGGALSIMTTALDKRIKMLVVLCPAMCDHTGYLNNRAGGWPHFFGGSNKKIYNNQKVLETLPYYDVVNFARMITVPGFYSWGFNDETTPPTSFYSAYNVIKANKQVFIIPDGKHKIYPEQVKLTTQWILNSFTK